MGDPFPTYPEHWDEVPRTAYDPRERLNTIHEALSHLKQSGQAVGAERITQLAGFAAPTVLNQAARLQIYRAVLAKGDHPTLDVVADRAL